MRRRPALADDLDRFARGEVLAGPSAHAARSGSGVGRGGSRRWRRGWGPWASSTSSRRSTTTAPARCDAQVSPAGLVVVALWIAASIVCQQLLESRRWSIPACFVWGTLDSLALLAVLRLGYGAASSLVVGYPLIIVASGLWFRVRFVWFITLLSLLSYGVLVIDFYYWRPELHEGMYAGFDRHVIFAAGHVGHRRGRGLSGRGGCGR